jgi:hypothetical protein
MRIFMGLIGAWLVVVAFAMTSWRFMGQSIRRPPTLWVRLVFFAAGLFGIYLSITGP